MTVTAASPCAGETACGKQDRNDKRQGRVALRPKQTNSSAIHSQMRERLEKTRMCEMFLKNACTKSADVCPFAHSEEEIRGAPNLRCTRMCTLFLAGKCPKSAETCVYAHSRDNLRSTSEFFKTQLCRHFEAGYCSKGAQCRHAHGVVDLRSPQDSKDVWEGYPMSPPAKKQRRSNRMQSSNRMQKDREQDRNAPSGLPTHNRLFAEFVPGQIFADSLDQWTNCWHPCMALMHTPWTVPEHDLLPALQGLEGMTGLTGLTGLNGLTGVDGVNGMEREREGEGEGEDEASEMCESIESVVSTEVPHLVDMPRALAVLESEEDEDATDLEDDYALPPGIELPGDGSTPTPFFLLNISGADVEGKKDERDQTNAPTLSPVTLSANATPFVPSVRTPSSSSISISSVPSISSISSISIPTPPMSVVSVVPVPLAANTEPDAPCTAPCTLSVNAPPFLPSPPPSSSSAAAAPASAQLSSSPPPHSRQSLASTASASSAATDPTAPHTPSASASQSESLLHSGPVRLTTVRLGELLPMDVTRGEGGDGGGGEECDGKMNSKAPPGLELRGRASTATTVASEPRSPLAEVTLQAEAPRYQPPLLLPPPLPTQGINNATAIRLPTRSEQQERRASHSHRRWGLKGTQAFAGPWSAFAWSVPGEQLQTLLSGGQSSLSSSSFSLDKARGARRGRGKGHAALRLDLPESGLLSWRRGGDAAETDLRTLRVKLEVTEATCLRFTLRVGDWRSSTKVLLGSRSMEIDCALRLTEASLKAPLQVELDWCVASD